MKVNTDGVLLGSLASHPCAAAILDIGAGTGVIALMLAQRYPDAKIDAVEVDEQAAGRAAENFGNSPFSERLRCHHTDFRQFNPMRLYDLIVSNPPYFTDSLKSQDEKKAIARHVSLLFFDHLLEKSRQWLNMDGILQVILPLPTAGVVQKKAHEGGFSLINQIDIRSFHHTEPVRTILSLKKQPTEVRPRTETHVIYAEKEKYTTGYKDLLKDFFLAF